MSTPKSEKFENPPLSIIDTDSLGAKVGGACSTWCIEEVGSSAVVFLRVPVPLGF